MSRAEKFTVAGDDQRAGRVALKAAFLAAAAYLFAMTLTKLIVPLVDDGDSFAGMGIAAVSLLVIAPLCAFIAAWAGTRAYRNHRAFPADRMLLQAAALALLSVTVLAYLFGGPTHVPTIILLGSASLMVLRSALIDRREHEWGTTKYHDPTTT